MLRIMKTHADEMIAHSRQEDPNECCGIIAGKDDATRKLYRITNMTPSPYRYMMSPQEQLNADKDAEKNGLEFLAFYHSHTHSPAYPSMTDVRMAQQSGYLSVYYILISLENKTSPQIRAFHIEESGDITEEKFEIA